MSLIGMLLAAAFSPDAPLLASYTQVFMPALICPSG